MEVPVDRCVRRGRRRRDRPAHQRHPLGLTRADQGDVAEARRRGPPDAEVGRWPAAGGASRPIGRLRRRDGGSGRR
ncbi:hypothetical protein FTX61_17030 [Nitriliruptoraceae bacterium ZYF776]|nr:hypothetical protein [Profundirhabdus halotolerans]